MQSNGHDTAQLSEARRALLQKYLRGELRNDGRASIRKRECAGPAPLSWSQQQIWLHAQLAGADLIYNEPITIHRRGPLDIFALERSFTEVVRRHEAWRTTFEWEGDHGVQIVHQPPTQVEIPLIDLRRHTEPEAEALRLATEDARRPFDLARGPMYRLLLGRLRDDEHRLFITLHHIIFDGVSLYRVFLPELLRLYEAFAKSETAQPPDLPIQYVDYAVWQRDSLGEIPPEHLAYWQDELRDLPALALKTDRPRPPRQTYIGAMERFQISPETTRVLKNLSQAHGATLFMTMSAAFVTLLQHYSGQEDIVVGGISSGRNREETMNLLGCFLNTVPIRCAFTKEIDFSELLSRIRHATLGALSHDEVPFLQLVEKFARKRDPSRAPLVQALIVVEPPLDPLPAGWAFTHMDIDTGTAKFDLQLGLDDRAEGFAGRFIYNTDLFERATIRELTSRWLQLLDNIAANPEARLCDLLETRAREQAMPPAEWSGLRTPYPRDSAIHKIFEEQAARVPNECALIFGNTTLTYDKLNRRANQLARRLQTLGVIRDLPIGVSMTRSPEMIISFLAILKAGGAYVPLDPSYPAERLQLMIEDSETPIILTIDSQPTFGAKSLCVTEEIFATEDDANLTNDVRATDLAYIIYTSGSTGVPKGVAIPHRAVVRLVKETDYVSFSPNETFLQLAPISFDASTFEIWGPLLNGGKLAIMETNTPTLEEIGCAIRNHGVTTLWLTAGLFNVMVDERLEDLRPLRQLLAGGDVLSVLHVRKAMNALTDTRFINGYGPTESTTFATCHRIDRHSLGENGIPIGKPIANTTAHILDAKMQRVPIGTVGELHIGGDGLARGYWQHGDWTAEKFVPDPFDAAAGARLYKTGDLARWRADGTIEFLGRADQQIKLRGFRIEPGEIEAVLKRQQDVRDAVVIAREDGAGQKHLVAYVVGAASSDTLSGALKKSLPDYMIPTAIVALAALPRTANGKIDRAALPSPDSLPNESQQELVAPRNDLEEKIAGIWKNVLGLKRVGVFDNFFDLGGHSLAGLRVVNQLSSAIGHQLSPQIFFEAPTIATMAELLRRKQSAVIQPVATTESVRPYLGLQVELIAIWQELLGRRDIGIRDNFFTIGGTSAQARGMLDRVARAFGKNISADRFSQNLTIEDLAAELARQAMSDSPTLVKINENGTRTPFFYLHGDLFGGGFYSLKLSRALGLDQPFYVMPPRDVRSPAVVPTVEEMAREHLEDLRSVQPHGPYIIGGFCLGGIVAYELAQQLTAAGEEVKMLLIIDAEPHDKGLAALRHTAEILGRLFRWKEHTQIDHFRRWWLRRAQFALWQREDAQVRGNLLMRQFRNRLHSVWNTLRRESLSEPASGTEFSCARDVPSTFLWASAGYRPKAYDGRLAVFLSEDLLHRGDHLAEAWARLARQLSVHSLKGSHLECITAHVDNLARTINQCLTTR